MTATPSRILLSLLSGFLLGVLFFSYFIWWLAGIMSCLLITVVWLVVLKRVIGRDKILLFGLLIIGLLVGVWRLDMAKPGESSIAGYTNQEISLTGVVLKRETGEGSQKIMLGQLLVNGQLVDDKILIFTAQFPVLELGDKVGLKCFLEKPEPFNGFAYDRYLAAKHIYATCYSRVTPFVLEAGAQNGVAIKIRKLHDLVMREIQLTLGEPHAQLLGGLVLGDDNFSTQWKEKFMRTGTSHVVAASGYNIALVSSLSMAALIYLGLWRQQAYPVVILAIIGFVILAGGEAAVTRAGIMGALALAATQLGRKSSPRNILLLVTAVMVFIEPRILRDDAGFQLSVLSTTGLMFAARPLANKLDFIPELFGLRESLASTLAATLFTLPVIVFSFGQLSVIGPLVNLLVLPFLPYAMAAGVLAVFMRIMTAGLVNIFVLPAWLFLELILGIISAMSDLPFAVLGLGG